MNGSLGFLFAFICAVIILSVGGWVVREVRKRTGWPAWLIIVVVIVGPWVLATLYDKLVLGL